MRWAKKDWLSVNILDKTETIRGDLTMVRFYIRFFEILNFPKMNFLQSFRISIFNLADLKFIHIENLNVNE